MCRSVPVGATLDQVIPQFPKRGNVWSLSPPPPDSDDNDDPPGFEQPESRRKKKKKTRVPPLGGEVQVDKDLDRMPHSFPPRDLGAPTPSTTTLNEPPEGALPAPPAVKVRSKFVPFGFASADATTPLPSS